MRDDLISPGSPASFTVVADDVSMADLYLWAHTCFPGDEAETIESPDEEIDARLAALLDAR